MFQVPSSNEGLIFHSNLFTDNQWQEAVFEKCIKSGVKKLAAKKKLLVDHPGNTVSNFFNTIFIVKQVVLLFSGINVQWPIRYFSVRSLKKANCDASKNDK